MTTKTEARHSRFNLENRTLVRPFENDRKMCRRKACEENEHAMGQLVCNKVKVFVFSCMTELKIGVRVCSTRVVG